MRFLLTVLVVFLALLVGVFAEHNFHVTDVAVNHTQSCCHNDKTCPCDTCSCCNGCDGHKCPCKGNCPCCEACPGKGGKPGASCPCTKDGKDCPCCSACPGHKKTDDCHDGVCPAKK